MIYPRPALLGVALGTGDALVRALDEKAGRVLFTHKATTWYRLALPVIGFVGELTRKLPTDIAETFIVCGMVANGTELGNAVVNNHGAGGATKMFGMFPPIPPADRLSREGRVVYTKPATILPQGVTRECPPGYRLGRDGFCNPVRGALPS